MLDNKNYRQLYIKYKKKYLKLKDEISGGSSLAAAAPTPPATPFYDFSLGESYTLKINNLNFPRQNLLTLKVNKPWDQVVLPLQQNYGFTQLYYDPTDPTDNILEYSTDEFNGYYGYSSEVTLYSLPIAKSPPKSDSKRNKESAFEIFAREQLSQNTIELRGNFEKINSKELIKSLRISDHAQERDEERSKRVSSAIGDLNNPETFKLGISVTYTPVGGTSVERYILISSQNVYVLSSNRTVIITLWSTSPAFNKWYIRYKSKKQQKLEAKGSSKPKQ